MIVRSIVTVLLESVMAIIEDTVRQYEALVRMIDVKVTRQRAALAQSELQLRGAKEALESAKRVK